MLYVGLDLSRKRLDWLALDQEGQPAAIGVRGETGHQTDQESSSAGPEPHLA
jgi:hypothetical protein